MKLNYLLLTILFFTLICCEQAIDSDGIERKNGLYINSTNGNTLDGKYKSVSSIGGAYSGNHVSTSEYKDGIPVREWTYTFNGDPIHSGKYLVEKELKSKINSLTKSKRTDLNLWEEGGYYIINLELISPVKVDSSLIKNVVNLTNQVLLEKFKYKKIDVFRVNDTVKEKVYSEKVK